MAKGLRLSVNGKNLTLHFLTVVGSTLHGLDNFNSDRDVKGVFTWDQNVVNGIVVPAEQLDNKNMRKEDRAELIAQLNKLFDTRFDDDLDLFLARKFFKNALKSDPNMLDMLNADKVPGMVLFCSDMFQNVLDNRELFLNFELAKLRFLGMSFNTFKLGSKQTAGKNKFKDLAKSLQSLFSFMNLVETGKFNPRLKVSQKDEVLAVKNNVFMKTDEEVVQLVKVMRLQLEAECDELLLPEDADKQEMFIRVNELLLQLTRG